ncbi:amidohydrolase family protein [Sphingobium sp.]|uniref:amidohydrolase family protein n=1 Tax=Sphingobium sp. TaxID=1912891 RepID=UPI002C087375|nr:amidohydrolase family protein [Sphingobium sp.]HUD92950.1 amidohydrolase family protein [Sphingobium sp.]
MPIIDTHQHIWMEPPGAMWERYTPDQMMADMAHSGHNIIGTVYIDSRAHYSELGPEHLRCVGETAFAEQVAQESLRRGGREAGACAAIATYADLMMGHAVGEVFDAHMAASPRFRGIRYMTAMDQDLSSDHWWAPQGIMKDPVFLDGFSELASRDLMFDAWIYHPQIPDLVELARRFPDTTIILDHLGGPLLIGRYSGREEESFVEWRKNMAALAECPNVSVKLGGVNSSTTGWSARDLPLPPSSEKTAEIQRRHMFTAIDLFGPRRCMFESNFPVDMVSISFTVLWNAFKRMTADFSDADRRDLFAGTASRVYRIPIAG